MYDHVEVYEKSINWAARLSREIPLLQEIIEGANQDKADPSILDVGSGTGHHLARLSSLVPRASFTGLEPDRTMVQHARDVVCKGRNNVVHFVDVFPPSSPLPGGPFDFVYSVGNTLVLAWGAAGVGAVFDALRAVVKPGGQVLFHVLNGEVPRDGSQVSPAFTLADGSTAFTVKHFWPDLDGATMRATFNGIICRPGINEPEIGWSRHAWPLVAWDELKGIIEGAGFSVDAAWGSYAKAPFEHGKSENLVCLLRHRRE